MKIIHVEDYFDPMAGYQINELVRAGSKIGDEVYIITSNCMKPFHKDVDIKIDKKYEKELGIKIIRLSAKLIISTRVIMKDLYKVIDSINPDLVYFHGIGDFKDLQLWKNKKDYKIVRDCHMSWVASQNKFRKMYYKLFKIFFAKKINNTSKYDKVFALGVEEYEYLKAIGINEDKLDFLYHGYNDDIIFFDEQKRNEIRAKYCYHKDDIIISYIGKMDNIKMPDKIFDILDKFDKKYIECKKIKLLFIGPQDKEYMKIFNKRKERVLNKVEVTIESSKSFSELKNYFSASDICIFPKQCTLSSIHAQICGCSVIMEKYSSNIERVIEEKNLYSIDKIDEATKILTDIIDKSEFDKKRNLNMISELKNREYKNQIKKLRNI
ncbi:glycosyltransferase family 4 protein [Clostridium gasigenes]|uniref:glycosyltransferase n=1 Tax=Clostridium gasigenes TaxID=94869 RepID=UPI00143861B9|nr:glycosyltransferase [Clostridium gasigenes]NKF08507.1 glycosyltransferase family 4 protein [Clostridium gasigenes]QSW21320.1 glycosyltransferase family 4 protein [Clostridium gasigenes]